MRFAIAFLCAATLSGCSELRPVTGPVPAGETLLVRYATPTEVRLIPQGDTGSMVLLREIRGRSRAVSGDTVRLVVSRARDAKGEEVYGGSLAIVKLGPGVRVETVRFDTEKTVLTVAGTFAVAAVGYGVLVLLLLINCHEC